MGKRDIVAAAYAYSFRALARRLLGAAVVLAAGGAVVAVGVAGLDPDTRGWVVRAIEFTARYVPGGGRLWPVERAAVALCEAGASGCGPMLMRAAAGALALWGAWGTVGVLGFLLGSALLGRRRARAHLVVSAPGGLRLMVPRDTTAAYRRMSDLGVLIPREWWSQAAAAVLEYLEAYWEQPSSQSHHDACPGGNLTHTLEALLHAVPRITALEDEALRRAAVVMVLAHDAGKCVRAPVRHDYASASIAWRAMISDPELRPLAAAVVWALFHRTGLTPPEGIREAVARLIPVLKAEAGAVATSLSVDQAARAVGAAGAAGVAGVAEAAPEAAPEAAAPRPSLLGRLRVLAREGAAAPAAAPAAPAAASVPPEVAAALERVLQAHEAAKWPGRLVLLAGRRWAILPRAVVQRLEEEGFDWGVLRSLWASAEALAEAGRATPGVSVELIPAAVVLSERLNVLVVGSTGGGEKAYFEAMTRVLSLPDALPPDLERRLRSFVTVRPVRLVVAPHASDAAVIEFCRRAREGGQP